MKKMREKIKNLKVWLIISGLIFASFVFAQNLPAEEGKVYVCPLAKKMEEVNPWCECRIDLVLNETVTSTCPIDGKTYEMTLTITEYEGKEYYAILGFEDGGAGVNFQSKADAGGPYEGFVGQKILIDASRSFDKNSDPLKFRFDFDGDGNWDTDWQDSPKVEKVFDKEFEGTLKVEVSDGMLSDIAQTQIKIKTLPASISGDFSCECESWGEWKDLGCGKGNCKENEMLRERERICFPRGCQIERETQCVESVSCVQIGERIGEFAREKTKILKEKGKEIIEKEGGGAESKEIPKEKIVKEETKEEKGIQKETLLAQIFSTWQGKISFALGLSIFVGFILFKFAKWKLKKF